MSNKQNNNPLAAFEANVGTREKSSKGKPSKPLTVSASNSLQARIVGFLLEQIGNAEDLGIEATVNGAAFEEITNFSSLIKDSRSSSFFTNHLNCNPAFAGLKFGVVSSEKSKFKSLSEITFTLAKADIAQIVSRKVGKVISSAIAQAYQDNELSGILSLTLSEQLATMTERWESSDKTRKEPTRKAALTALKGIKRDVRKVMTAFNIEA